MKELTDAFLRVTETALALSGYQDRFVAGEEMYQFLFLPTFARSSLVVFETSDNRLYLSLYIFGEAHGGQTPFQDMVALSQEQTITFFKLIEENQPLHLDHFLQENTRDGIIIRCEFRNKHQHHLFFTDTVLDAALSTQYCWIDAIVDIVDCAFANSEVVLYLQRLKTYF